MLSPYFTIRRCNQCLSLVRGSVPSRTRVFRLTPLVVFFRCTELDGHSTTSPITAQAFKPGDQVGCSNNQPQLQWFTMVELGSTRSVQNCPANVLSQRAAPPLLWNFPTGLFSGTVHMCMKCLHCPSLGNNGLLSINVENDLGRSSQCRILLSVRIFRCFRLLQ